MEQIMTIYEEKRAICKQISDVLDTICPKDSARCSIVGCNKLHQCNRMFLDPTGINYELPRLKKYQKTIQAELMKFESNIVPTKEHQSKTPKPKVNLTSDIALYLGDIHKHPLLKRQKSFIKQIEKANSLKAVLRVMEAAYLKKHGVMFKSFNKPYGKDK